MDELNKKFKQWCDFDFTHRGRQINIMRRHSTNINQWVDLIFANPVFPIEQKEAVLVLHGELSNIFEEIQENYLDLANDAYTFANILDLLKKEVERLPDD